MGLLTFGINVTLDGCCDHTAGIVDDELHDYFTGLMDDAGAMLWGRTTYEMSAERSEAERIPAEALQPGDVVFFGNKGPRSKPSQVGHMGILLGPGWMVHSGGNGVTIAPLEGWYAERLAWGRRPLAEAGLA